MESDQQSGFAGILGQYGGQNGGILGSLYGGAAGHAAQPAAADIAAAPAGANAPAAAVMPGDDVSALQRALQGINAYTAMLMALGGGMMTGGLGHGLQAAAAASRPASDRV